MVQINGTTVEFLAFFVANFFFALPCIHIFLFDHYFILVVVLLIKKRLHVALSLA
jgi:hypothetical protein